MEAKNQSVRLTMAVAAKAPLPTKSDYILRDSQSKSLGFGLRIYASGAKSWIVQKKIGRQPLRVVLGSFPIMTMESALKEARKAAGKIAHGVNPLEEKRKLIKASEEDKAKKQLTVHAGYLEFEEAKKEKRSERTIRDRATARKLLEGGRLWKTSVFDVDELALNTEFKRLVALGKRGAQKGTTQAASTMRWLRAAYKFTVLNHKLILPNPFAAFNKLQPGWDKNKQKTRTIAQTEKQLTKWWNAVEALRAKTSKVSADAKTIADFLILSVLWGSRKGELLPLCWDAVNFKDKTVKFEKTKGGRPHIIPFGKYAGGLLKNRFAENQKSSSPSAVVFPSSRRKRDGTHSHITEPKKTIAAVAKAAKVPFSPHDLRRTFATLMVEIGVVSTATLEKVLNHAQTTTAGKHYIVPRLSRLRLIYQRYEDNILKEAGVKTVR